jgi:hypothetical protein
MVASARYGPAEPEKWSQRLAIGVDVVAAPADGSASTTVAAFAEAGPALLQQVARTRPVLVDLGRLSGGSRVMGVLEVADRLLLVARPELEDIRHVAAALPLLQQRCLVELVLCGVGRYTAAEIADFLGLEMAAVVEPDRPSADVVAGRRQASLGWTRRRLPTAARALALRLTADTSAPEPTAATESEADPTLTPRPVEART